jgi:hypothetical protein
MPRSDKAIKMLKTPIKTRFLLRNGEADFRPQLSWPRHFVVARDGLREEGWQSLRTDQRTLYLAVETATYRINSAEFPERSGLFKVVVRNPQRVRRIHMQTKPQQITPVFGPETQFDVRTTVVHTQSEVIELQESFTTSLLPTSATKTFEQKGVPFSALHD